MPIGFVPAISWDMLVHRHQVLALDDELRRWDFSYWMFQHPGPRRFLPAELPRMLLDLKSREGQLPLAAASHRHNLPHFK
ncbi:MAG: hypothetical protein WB611_02930 [Stellaceae bacterium]